MNLNDAMVIALKDILLLGFRFIYVIYIIYIYIFLIGIHPMQG